MSYDNRDDIGRMLEEKRALDAYFTSVIQDAAGSTPIRRQPITGPDWPVRSDYVNRAEFRRACAEWRRKP
jgi:hypothetical protein